MKKRFVARDGSHQTIFWAKDLQGAYALFDSWYSEAFKYLSWNYIISEESNQPEPIVDFLKSAGRSTGITIEEESMSETKLPDEVRKYMSDLGKKGGKANPAGTAKRKKQARAAAAKRWAKYREEQEQERIHSGAEGAKLADQYDAIKKEETR